MAYTFDMFDVVKSHEDRLVDQLYTSLPATVTSYNASKQSVDVSVDVRQPETLSRGEMPPMALTDVPVIFPSGGGGILSFPIKSGDKVLLCFSMMSLDLWKERGAGVCGDNRLHSNNDAIAIAGLFNLKSNLTPSGTDIELKGFGSTITLRSSGDVDITSSGNVNIKPSGTCTVESDLLVSGDIVASGQVRGNKVIDTSTNNTLGTHTHPSNGAPPTGGT